MRIIIFLLLITYLSGRENPFIPVINNENRVIVKKNKFESASTMLPSDARVLKSVTFTYQTLTGSILTKTININQEIDWHSPIYVYQNKINIKPQKIKVGFLNFYIKKHKVFIETNDKLIRIFVLVKPFRFVLDFKSNRDFLTYRKSVNSFIKKIVIGNHSDFYRVVLYADGVYKPILKKIVEGYLIDFK